MKLPKCRYITFPTLSNIVILFGDDIKAIDKSISRQYKQTETYIQDRFDKYENTINDLQNSNAKYIAMRDKLKYYLEDEYNSEHVMKLFTDITAHHIIGAKLKYMFDL